MTRRRISKEVSNQAKRVFLEAEAMRKKQREMDSKGSNMKKYQVYGTISGSVLLGIYEAETPEQAIEKSEGHDGYGFSVCHKCSADLQIGDIEDVVAIEIP